jgi:hypothetical protein
MARLSQALIVALLAGSAAAVAAQPPARDPKAAEVPVPSAGTVESVSGEVMRATASGWVPVRTGESLPDGTQVQLLRGAVLVIRFAPDEVRRFSPERARTPLPSWCGGVPDAGPPFFWAYSDQRMPGTWLRAWPP